MTARPWRGTWLFVGAAAAVATATVVRYADVPPLPAPTDTRVSGTIAARAAAGTTQATTHAHTVVGDAVQIKYGSVQVAVTFTGTTITHVSTLRSPDGHPRSRSINARAIPVLQREAVAASSARIDTVSGATYTSEGYRRSLQSVLDRLG